MNDFCDLRFPLQATKPIPVDHGYMLFGALSRMVPAIHRNSALGLHSIRGVFCGRGQLQTIAFRSSVAIRTSFDFLRELIPLAGMRIALGSSTLQLGVPEIRPLLPHDALESRIVSIKGYTELDPFRSGLARQIENLALESATEVDIRGRRVFRIKGRAIVGFTVRLSRLSKADSLKIQTQGLGGRRHLGCGVFVESKLDAAANEEARHHD